MREEAEILWFLYGFWLFNKFFGIKVYHHCGTKSSVDFSWKKGWNPFVLGWMHSHSFECGCNPSSIDNKTMRSWVRARNRPLISAIDCEGKELWYLYYRDSNRDIRRVLLEFNYWGNHFVTGFIKK